jgi:phage terminase large subunit-like protein
MEMIFNQRKADYVVKFFENLKHTKGTFQGQPFTLLPWENQIIRDVYGTVRADGLRQFQKVYVEIPKKNGKSELAAGAGLLHTFGDGEIKGEVYGCAADRQQASIVFDVAIDMIDQVPALKKRAKLNMSHKRITDKITGTYYQVLSAEAFTKHGLNPSAVIFDELHAQPNRDLWDVMTFGAGDARAQPIWWIITTAGDDPDRVSIGWEVHEYASKILAGDVVDPLWYAVIYGYDGEDIYNPDNWAKANPSMGHTITLDKVQSAANTAMQNKANERLFRWLRLNQWITTKLTTWQPIELFDRTVGTWDRRDLIGKDCFVGLDLSSTTDLTGTALVFPPQGSQLDWRVIWDCWIPEVGMQERIRNDRVPYDLWASQGWVTPTEGEVVDYTKVEERILVYKTLYNVKELGADRTFAAMLLQRLEQKSMTCVDVPQSYATLTDPMNQIEVLMKNGKLTHEPHPVARWCFGNTSVAKNGNGQIKYVKESRGKSIIRTKRIDLTAAWVISQARGQFYKGKVDLSAAILSDDWGM